LKLFVKLFKHTLKFNHPLFKNSLFNAGGFVFVSLVGLIITPLLVKYFGMEQYGVYVLITGIFGYYGIFDFGLGQGLIKFVAEYNAQGKQQKLNDAVNSVLWFQFGVGLLVSILIYVLSPWIINILNVSKNYFKDSVVALKIATFGFFFSMLSGTFSASIRGLERFDITSTTDSFLNLIQNLLVLGVLILGFGIIETVKIHVAIALIQIIIYYFLFNRIYNTYKLKLIFRKKIVRSFFSFAGYLFLSKINGILRQQGTRLLLSIFLSPAAVTLFVVPNKLLTAAGGLLSSIAGTLFPFISKLNSLSDKKKINNVFIKANFIFTSLSLPLFLFITCFSKSILYVWMGENFANNGWKILSLLSGTSFFASLTMIPINTVLGLGISQLILLFSIVNFLLFLLILPLFTYYYGVIGTASGMFIIGMLNIFYVIRMAGKKIGVNVNEYLFIIFKKHIIPIVLFIGLALFIQKYNNINHLIKVVLGIFIMLNYYIIILFNLKTNNKEIFNYE